MSSDPRPVLHDLTPAVTADLQVFPGDTPPTREVLLDMARGDHLTLSSLRATVHLGAHADAPSHYGLDAPDIATVPVDRFVGPCRVVRLATPPGGRVTAERLPDGDLEERLLIATGSYPDPTRPFADGFAAIDPDLVEAAASRGVRLLGVDTPSVDRADAKRLRAHHACLRHDVQILEGLLLADVAEGRYELIALPLRLVGFDGSPVRAVLRALG